MLVSVKMLNTTEPGEGEDVVLEINGERYEIGVDYFHDSYPEVIRDIVGRELTTEETSWTWNEGTPSLLEMVSREFPDHVFSDDGGRCYCPLCNHTSNDDPKYMAWKQRQPHTPNTQLPDVVRQPILEEARQIAPRTYTHFFKEGGSQWASISVVGLKGSHYRRYEAAWDQPGGKWIVESPEYAKRQGLDVLEHEKINKSDYWLLAAREANHITKEHITELPDDLSEHAEQDTARVMQKYFRPISKMDDGTLYFCCLRIVWSWRKNPPAGIKKYQKGVKQNAL